MLPAMLAAALAVLTPQTQTEPPAWAQPPPERPQPPEEPPHELGDWIGSAGLGWTSMVFNQTVAPGDPATAVASFGLSIHAEVGRRFSKGSQWGVVGAATLGGTLDTVISNFTSGAAMLGAAVRFDAGEGLRASLGLGAGSLLLHHPGGDQTAISLAPFAHFDYPPPLFPPWLCLQGTFAYMPVPAPLRAFFAGVGLGVVY